MNTKKFISGTFLFAIVAIIVGFSACDRVSQIIQPTTPQMLEIGEEIAIGVVLPLTGRLANSFGIPMQQGFELALSEINSTQSNSAKLKFIIEDDQSTIEGSVEAFNKLINEAGVSVILGSATSSQTEMTFPIAQENQVVALSSTSSARGLSAIGDFVFRVSLTTDKLIPAGIEVTQAKLGYQTAATLYDEIDLFSTDGDAAVQEGLKARGIEVLTTETFQGGDTDFREQLTRIQTLNPDVIFVSSLSPEKPGILRQAHELGISAPFIMRTLTAEDVHAAGPAAESAISFINWNTSINTPGNQAFIQNYSEIYGTAPNNYAARSYAALHILAAAIAKAQSTEATSIRDALNSI
ncbi:MAG: ABC transporter substrate-binding protein, partial [Candidatus Poribacteria bacterium]|nr:ABC transporter substrate-binding protein [Candidatus Poribacteria bacterium]